MFINKLSAKAFRENDFKSILNGTTVNNQKGDYILKLNLPIGVQNLSLKFTSLFSFKNDSLENTYEIQIFNLFYDIWAYFKVEYDDQVPFH